MRDRDGAYRYVSPAAEELTGLTLDEFYARPNLMRELVHPDDLPLWDETSEKLIESRTPQMVDLRILRPDGELRWIRHHAGPVFDEQGEFDAIRATSIDITQQKAYEDYIRKLADYDPLTEMPNRRYIQRELEHRVLSAGEAHAGFAVIFMDLNRFKYVNDAHGHTVGDGLLRQLARRLQHCCQRDGSLVGRFGGDEFVIVLPVGSTRGQAEAKVQTLLAAADEPFEQDGMRFSLGASIGVSLFPQDGEDAEALIKNADAAMYQAKRGTSDSRFFAEEMGHFATEAVRWETHLREAINEKLIEVHYQPIVDLGTGRAVAAEALARWRQPDGSYVSPLTFIPLAEELGRIHQLDAQVAEKACRQLQAWRAAGFGLKMSINVSARRFQQVDFLEDMFRIINEHALEPYMLKLELTESTLVEDLDNSRERIRMLRETGIEVAIDDFGTGFSSLGYLTSLPMDVLKLDRSFVRAMNRGKRHRAVVEGVLQLSRSLEMTVIAEGIENADQQRMLASMGCEEGQGFYFAKPMPAEEFEQWLRRNEQETRARPGENHNHH